MHICFVNPTRVLRPYIRYLSKHLVSKGHRVTILTPTIPEKHQIEELAAIRIRKYPSAFIPKIRYTIPFFPEQFRILREVHREDRIDIINLWTNDYPVLWAPLFFGKRHGIPVVLSLGALAGVDWSYGVRFVDFVGKVYSKSVGRLALKWSDRLFLWNPRMMSACREIGIPEDRITVCLPGVIDTERFTRLQKANGGLRASLGLAEDEAMLLNVGRLVPVKGIDTLIKITRRLIEDGFKIKMVIVGTGPYREKYEEMARAYGVREHVIFTGFRKDIPEIMAACDVFVFPSVSEEVANALIEVSLCGKPAVVSDVGGLPEITIQGKTGFLAQPKDVDGFVGHIKVLLNNKTLSEELGRNAREHVLANASWERFARVNEEMYLQLCQRKKT